MGKSEERKDVSITIKTGKLTSSKPPAKQLEEELKRHFIGAITSIVKWSKTIEKELQKQAKHEDQYPQDQAAIDKPTTSLEYKEKK